MLSENGPKGEFNSLSLCFVSSLFSASAKTNIKSCDTQFLIYYTIPYFLKVQNLYNLDNVRPWLKAARAHARDECSAVAMERPILSMDCIGIVHKKWKKMVENFG